MSTLLMKGAPLVARLDAETQHYIDTHGLAGTSLSIFLCNDTDASKAYVNLKRKKAKSFGLEAEIITRPEIELDELLAMIEERNQDEHCLGMIVQLPLPAHLQPHYGQIMTAIDAAKDLDGLGGVNFGTMIVGAGAFIPATPKATVMMIQEYYTRPLAGSSAVVIGQSNLVGKPIAARLMNEQVTVVSGNSLSDRDWLAEQVRRADIVVTATGVRNLLGRQTDRDQTAMRDTFIFDAGRGKTDGIVHGDTDRAYFAEYVGGVTPVPGGVGPVTVSCIFHNLIDLST